MPSDLITTARSGQREDRAQSIAVTHAVLLGFVITLTLGVAAAGAGPIIDAQSQVTTTIATDHFEEWDEAVESTIRSGSPQRRSMTVPTGSYIGGGDQTEITITNLDTGSTTTITTDRFRYTPRGSEKSVRYDAGLITQLNSDTSRPSVSANPDQTQFTTGGTDILTLSLIEYDLQSPITFQTAYSREFVYNLYPNASRSKTVQHGVGTDTEIEIQSPNYESWDRYFTDNSHIYSTINVNDGSNTVTARVENTELRVRSRYIRLNESNP